MADFQLQRLEIYWKISLDQTLGVRKKKKYVLQRVKNWHRKPKCL